MSTSFIFVLLFTFIALGLVFFNIVAHNLNAKDIVFSFTALCAAFLMFSLNVALSLKDEIKEEVIPVELSLHNMVADIHSLSFKKSKFFIVNREEISKEVTLNKYFKISALNNKNFEDENFYSFSIESGEQLDSAIKDISKFIHIGIIGEMLSNNPDWEIYKNKKTFRSSSSFSFNTSAENAGKNTYVTKNELDRILRLTSFSYENSTRLVDGLTLPPESKIKVKDNILTIENPFVKLQFSIDIDPEVRHVPPKQPVHAIDGNYSNTSYISANLMIKARFKKERFGSRKMESYKKWIMQITKDFRKAFEFRTVENMAANGEI